MAVKLEKVDGDREKEQNQQQKRETEAQSSEEGMQIRSERNAFPRRAASRLSRRPLLQGGQAEEGSEGLWHAEQGDGRASGRCITGIARQSLGKRETVMGTPCS